MPKGTLPCLVWDTEDPYHYLRTAPGDNDDDEFLIVGGEDHKTGQEEDFEARSPAPR